MTNEHAGAAQERESHDENELIHNRRLKLEKLYGMDINPYGRRYEKESDVSDLKANFSDGVKVSLAGRLISFRLHGKSMFGNIKDRTGSIQFYLRADKAGKDRFDMFKETFDIGDIIGIKGETFTTRTGEPTVMVEDFEMLSKSLRPLPEKWHGLKDVETRYRHRYVDLIVNDSTRDIFRKRVSVINGIRDYLNGKGFLEVETPMMHPIAGGAAGKPFKTHHNTLDMDLFLRIAPELYLKKLLVGGFEKIYEINRSFRNEGISVRHNPEFTMLEVYQAYSDCRGMMDLTREMITEIALQVTGSVKFLYQEQEIDLSEWKEVSLASLMKERFDINPEDSMDLWCDKLKAQGVKIEQQKLSRTQLINIITEMLEPHTQKNPIFVTDFFAELCPLAKRKKENPLLTDRFELFIGGMELANAYSELNDPLEQRERFKAQAKEDGETNIDEDFVTALEYGMPPAGGLGIGIDRLVMILTDSPSIREVILFPQMRPKDSE